MISCILRYDFGASWHRNDTFYLLRMHACTSSSADLLEVPRLHFFLLRQPLSLLSCIMLRALCTSSSSCNFEEVGFIHTRIRILTESCFSMTLLYRKSYRLYWISKMCSSLWTIFSILISNFNINFMLITSTQKSTFCNWNYLIMNDNVLIFNYHFHCLEVFYL